MLKESGYVHKPVAVLFASNNAQTATRLEQSLGDAAVLVRLDLDPSGICRCVQEELPDIVLLDFQDIEGNVLDSQVMAVAKALQETCQGTPQAAVCCYRQPHSAVAALRAGIRDIIDLDDDQELLPLIHKLTGTGAARRRRSDDKKRRKVMLMGTRAGMGVSTLAVHMASLWQERLLQNRAAKSGDKSAVDLEALPLLDRVGLVDLGMPTGDCLLYMGLASNFHFVDAVRGIQRLDETLLRSAVAHDDQGVSVLAWPNDMQAVSEVPHEDSLLLCERLAEHYGLLLADVGGFSSPKFLADMAQSMDAALIVADQSVGSLISLAELVQALGQHGVTPGRLGLILNRYDERYGMSASQIEQRFGVPLKGIFPDRALPLRSSMNQGMLLHAQSRRDPYIRALEKLIDSLMVVPEQNKPTKQRWWQGLRR